MKQVDGSYVFEYITSKNREKVLLSSHFVKAYPKFKILYLTINSNEKQFSSNGNQHILFITSKAVSSGIRKLPCGML